MSISEALNQILSEKSTYRASGGKRDNITALLEGIEAGSVIAERRREWEERQQEKNKGRQRIMSDLARGTSTTFNDDDLKIKKERFKRYYDQYKGDMDEHTLEMGQFILDEFDLQGKKNTAWNKVLGDSEQLKSDLMYDMDNIGVDEEGNPRTLNDNDYKIITEQQKRWIDHTKEIQTKFAERLNMPAFKHVGLELANATNMNHFLLAQAREDNLIDDRELQAYKDAWTSGSYDPVAKYLNDEKAGRDAAINFNINQIGQGAQRYQELYNFFENKGVISYKDEQGNQLGISLENLESQPDGSPKQQFLIGLGEEYNSLEGRLKNLRNNTMKMTGTDFLADTGITFDESEKPNIEQLAKERGMTVEEYKIASAGIDEEEKVSKVEEVTGLTSDDYKEVSGDIKKTTGALAFMYGLSKADKVVEGGKWVANKTNKSARYIKSAANLSNTQIDEFLNSKSVRNTMKHLDDLEAKLKDPDLEKTMRQGNRPPETYESVRKKINKIKTNQAKYWAKKFNVDEEDIGRLLKSKNREKWNVFKMKRNLTRKFPSVAGKLGRGYTIGSLVTDIAGIEAEGGKRMAIDIGAGYATEKAVTKKFLPKLTKMLASDKGKKYLAKAIGKQAAKKIVTGAAAGGGSPASIAFALIGTGLAAYDIYKLIQNWKEEE